MDPMKQQQPHVQPVFVAQPPRAVNTSALQKVIPGILGFLMFAFNIVFLAGVAAAQARCKDLENPWIGIANADYLWTLAGVRENKLDGGKTESTNLMSAGEQCRHEYSFHWWVVFFQLISLALAIAVAFSSVMRSRFGNSVALWIAVVTALVMYLASLYDNQLMYIKIAQQQLSNQWNKVQGQNPSNNERSAYNSVKDDADGLEKATQAAFAGVIVLSILNLIYLFISSDSALAPKAAVPQQAAPQAYVQEMPQAVAYTVPPPNMSQEIPPAGAHTYTPQPTYGAPTYGAPAPTYGAPAPHAV